MQGVSEMKNDGFSEFFTFENMTKSNKYKQAVEANRREALEFLNSGRKLSFLCEDIREILGVPMIETSGFRGATLSTIGGFSLTSSHTRFEALDVVPVGMSVDRAFDIIKANAIKLPNLRKVIKEKVGGKVWLHIECMTKEGDILAFYETSDGVNYKKV